MLELPETTAFARQIADALGGSTVSAVFGATQPHKLTWFEGDPEGYPELLTGRTVVAAEGHGSHLDIVFDDEVHLVLSEGVMPRLYDAGEKVPAKYQLLVAFEDGRFLVCSVAMYGGIQAFRGSMDYPYYRMARERVSPLSEEFDERYFDGLFERTLAEKRTASAKAFLATEQRVPGLGNGVVQDILFRARINPRRKIATLSADERHGLFEAVKGVLSEMTAGGGRDTERDIFGAHGRYRTVLSKNTCAEPCPVCGATIVKEPYLGGAVYYCPKCQFLDGAGRMSAL